MKEINILIKVLHSLTDKSITRTEFHNIKLPPEQQNKKVWLFVYI